MFDISIFMEVTLILVLVQILILFMIIMITAINLDSTNLGDDHISLVISVLSWVLWSFFMLIDILWSRGYNISVVAVTLVQVLLILLLMLLMITALDWCLRWSHSLRFGSLLLLLSWVSWGWLALALDDLGKSTISQLSLLVNHLLEIIIELVEAITLLQFDLDLRDFTILNKQLLSLDSRDFPITILCESLQK